MPKYLTDTHFTVSIGADRRARNRNSRKWRTIVWTHEWKQARCQWTHRSRLKRRRCKKVYIGLYPSHVVQNVLYQCHNEGWNKSGFPQNHWFIIHVGGRLQGSQQTPRPRPEAHATYFRMQWSLLGEYSSVSEDRSITANNSQALKTHQALFNLLPQNLLKLELIRQYELLHFIILNLLKDMSILQNAKGTPKTNM